MVKMFRVVIAFFLALICVGSFVSVSTVSPAWAVDAWAQVGSDIDAEATGDQSGSSVSLSADGSRVAVASPYNDGAGPDAGHVRVYDLTAGGTWEQVGSDIDGAAYDISGYSLSLSPDGSTVAIGAIDAAGGGTRRGTVRVYALSGSVWGQVGADINGEANSDQSGYSVSLSNDGSRVAIGAQKNDAGGSDAGHVRVYNLFSGGWVQVGADIDGAAAGDYSGTSVSLSSDGARLAIGEPWNDSTPTIQGGGTNAGQVRLYDLTGGAWVQLGSGILGESANDNFGSSVSLSADGTHVAAGAIHNISPSTMGASDTGHVRVYRWPTWDPTAVAWVQSGQDIDGEAGGDNSGMSVSLNSNGTRLAIGARGNNATGSDAGHVRVYENYFSSIWNQIGIDIDGEAAEDNSGHSVSLSSDGCSVAIGAPLNSGAGSYAGHARVYAISCGGGGGDSGITSKPRSLKVSDETPHSRTLRWRAPASLNGGSITDYIIQYRARGTTGWSTFADDISTSRTVKVTGLTRKMEYKFQVAASTTAGDSPYSTATTPFQ